MRQKINKTLVCFLKNAFQSNSNEIFRLAEVCLAKSDFPKGLEYISAIEEYPDVTPPYIIRAALFSSQITCASSSLDNGTAVATNCIMRLCSALELAAQNHLSYYKALVKMHLANIQVSSLYYSDYNSID